MNLVANDQLRASRNSLPEIGKVVKTPVGSGILSGKVLRGNGTWKLLVRFLPEALPPAYAQPMKGCRWVVMAFEPGQVEVL